MCRVGYWEKPSNSTPWPKAVPPSRRIPKRQAGVARLQVSVKEDGDGVLTDGVAEA